MSEFEPTRRNVLYGAAAAGVAVPILAACGSDDGGNDVVGESPEDTGTDSSTSSGGVSASDVPVGGGEILQDQKVVVTQPEAGTFKAFSATCTHQGCTVGSVSDGLIHCPCHGSAFNIADGSVANGPATSPLAEKTVTVDGDTLTIS